MTTPEDRIKAAKQALYDLIVDHPMWIDGDGNPLDYSPDREAAIGDFLDAAESVLAALFPAAETRERYGIRSENGHIYECPKTWTLDDVRTDIKLCGNSGDVPVVRREHVGPWEVAEDA